MNLLVSSYSANDLQDHIKTKKRNNFGNNFHAFSLKEQLGVGSRGCSSTSSATLREPSTIYTKANLSNITGASYV
jgi:hypothetical protein